MGSHGGCPRSVIVLAIVASLAGCGSRGPSAARPGPPAQLPHAEVQVGDHVTAILESLLSRASFDHSRVPFSLVLFCQHTLLSATAATKSRLDVTELSMGADEQTRFSQSVDEFRQLLTSRAKRGDCGTVATTLRRHSSFVFQIEGERIVGVSGPISVRP